jgi:RNA-directed DNA polymerase
MLTDKDLIELMSVELGMFPEHLYSIIRTAPLRYKVFYIKKRNGGLREVAQPAREVKAIQRWLIRKLEPQLPIHRSVTAYQPGSSIKLNALSHVRSNYLLKMDFKDFFPSILSTDVARHIESCCDSTFDSTAAKLIARACTWAPGRQLPLRLCIGAPSSPLISNSIMYALDCQIAALVEIDGVTYTRYADDLAFSSEHFDVLGKYPSLVKKLVQEIEYPHLIINEHKTVFASKAGKRILTGITLTPEQGLSIGRDRKRLIRAMFHRHLQGQLSQKEEQKLIGLLAFADSIEPDFSKRLKKDRRYD